MDSFEFNKIAAAVLVTALLFIGIKEIGNFVYKVDKPKKSAYKIEGVADNTKTTNEKVKIEENNYNVYKTNNCRLYTTSIHDQSVIINNKLINTEDLIKLLNLKEDDDFNLVKDTALNGQKISTNKFARFARCCMCAL